MHHAPPVEVGVVLAGGFIGVVIAVGGGGDSTIGIAVPGVVGLTMGTAFASRWVADREDEKSIRCPWWLAALFFWIASKGGVSATLEPEDTERSSPEQRKMDKMKTGR